MVVSYPESVLCLNHLMIDGALFSLCSQPEPGPNLART